MLIIYCSWLLNVKLDKWILCDIVLILFVFKDLRFGFNGLWCLILFDGMFKLMLKILRLMKLVWWGLVDLKCWYELR